MEPAFTGIPGCLEKNKKLKVYQSIVKPFLDRLVAVVILLVCSPVLLLMMLILSMVNKGKVWFIQPRPGREEKIFNVIKFKTMRDSLGPDGQLLPDEQRLTAIGKFIRTTSLDEVPQLINVVIGDMSIVGPRPLLVEYLPLYSDRQKRRHFVKPGITGWAQVNGRNAISWEQKFEYDQWYVQHISFSLDLKILFLTVIKIFKAEGISSDTSVTMEKFRGNT